MSAALKACLDYYARFSTPSTLAESDFGNAIENAADHETAADSWLDTGALADAIRQSIWDLAGELPSEGWLWAPETHADLARARALMLQALEIMKCAHERELPRFREWDERTTREHQAARSNVVSIRR